MTAALLPPPAPFYRGLTVQEMRVFLESLETMDEGYAAYVAQGMLRFVDTLRRSHSTAADSYTVQCYWRQLERTCGLFLLARADCPAPSLGARWLDRSIHRLQTALRIRTWFIWVDDQLSL